MALGGLTSFILTLHVLVISNHSIFVVMLFNSLKFFLIFPLIFGIYWGIPVRWNQVRKVFLILVSYLLYMNFKPAFALVLLAVTLVTYWGGADFRV